MARARRGAAGWAALIDEWHGGGLSLPAFCRRRGLNLGTMRGWAYKRAHRLAIERVRAQAPDGPAPGGDSSATAFLPAHLTGPITMAGSGVEVVLGLGRRIAVAPGFDPEASRRVVAAFEDRPC